MTKRHNGVDCDGCGVHLEVLKTHTILLGDSYEHNDHGAWTMISEEGLIAVLQNDSEDFAWNKACIDEGMSHKVTSIVFRRARTETIHELTPTQIMDAMAKADWEAPEAGGEFCRLCSPARSIANAVRIAELAAKIEDILAPTSPPRDLRAAVSALNALRHAAAFAERDMMRRREEGGQQ